MSQIGHDIMTTDSVNFKMNDSGMFQENAMDKLKEYHCSTGDLMGPLGLLVQALLAFLAFTSLIGKSPLQHKLTLKTLTKYLLVLLIHVIYTYDHHTPQESRIVSINVSVLIVLDSIHTYRSNYVSNTIIQLFMDTIFLWFDHST